MASNIDSQYGSTTTLPLTLGTTVDTTEGRISTAVIAGGGAYDATIPVPPQVQIFYKISTGNAGTTLVANSLIEFYFARSDGVLRDSNLGATDADVLPANFDKSQLQFVHAQVTNSTPAAATYYGSFIVDNPGPSWTLLIVNETGDELAASPHDINYRYISPEVQ